MEVPFITLGDLAKRLDVPPPTLRNWTDQLEEMDVHYVKRNNRNERIYDDSDYEIFRFVRDLRQEYGRKTTMRDIARLLMSDDRFQLRSHEDAPSPVIEPSNKTGDILSPDDIERLMQNQRVQALVSYMIAQVEENMQKKNSEFLKEVVEKYEIISVNILQDIKEKIEKEYQDLKEELNSFDEDVKANLEEKLTTLENQTKSVLEEKLNSFETQYQQQFDNSMSQLLEKQNEFYKQQNETLQRQEALINELIEENKKLQEQQKKSKKKFLGIF